MKTGFGWIGIRGTRYEHDGVIHTDGHVAKRKKKVSKQYRDRYGHTPLSAEELAFLADERPYVVYIGTGQDGSLPVMPEAVAFLSSFELVQKPTPDILPEIEQEHRPFVAILHVTC